MADDNKPERQWEIHLAAERFPMMSDTELKDLAEDIKAYGLREPMVLFLDYSDQVARGVEPGKAVTPAAAPLEDEEEPRRDGWSTADWQAFYDTRAGLPSWTDCRAPGPRPALSTGASPSG
jgi:hypothetical protein